VNCRHQLPADFLFSLKLTLSEPLLDCFVKFVTAVNEAALQPKNLQRFLLVGG
jgi:hypothetical protein